MAVDISGIPGSIRKFWEGHSLDACPLSRDANVSNCFNLRQRFFEKYQGIDCNLLIAYWMMAGYLDPFSSVEEGYGKGYNVLMELKRQGIVYEDMNKIAASTVSNLNHCRHEQPCPMTNIGFDDFLDIHELEKLTLTDGMLKDENGSFLLTVDFSWSQCPRDLISSAKSLKYIACFSSFPDGVRLLLENVDNPAMLLLHDCRFLLNTKYSFEKLATLTVLEISISSKVEYIPEVILTELPQLQYLNLSDLVIAEFSELKQLRSLIITHCFWFATIPSLENLSNLEVLNLSCCKGLTLSSNFIICPPKLQMLDLSNTQFECMPQLKIPKLNHLSLRKLEWRDCTNINHPGSLQLLDLSGSGNVKQVDLTEYVQLRKLILRSCTSLQELTALEKLESLEVLDVAGCELLTELQDLSNLRKLEVLILSGTKVRRLPSFANPSCLLKLSLQGLNLDTLETLASLSNLMELDLGDVKISSSHEFKVDFLESFHSLQFLNLSGTNVSELPGLANLKSLKQLLLERCPLLNTLPDSKVLKNLEKLELHVRDHSSKLWNLVLKKPSAVDDKDSDYTSNDSLVSDGILSNKLEVLIILMQSASESVAEATSTNITGSVDNNTYKWQLKMLIMDLKYINKHIFSLNESSNRNKAKELLQHLVNSDYPSEDACEPHSLKLQQLLYTIAKLKLMVPRIQSKDVSESSETAMKSHYITNKRKENYTDDIAKELVSLKIPQPETAQLLSSYASLTNKQKQCLLCFSVFPCHGVKTKDTGIFIWKSLEIRKKILIYWWVGEGFMDLHFEENVAEVSEEVTPPYKGEKKKTVEEIGEQILKVFTEKGFIEPVIEKDRETGRCCMHPFVHSFVIEQSKRDAFFDFSHENTKLTPSFTHSHRACILKAQDNLLSSCQRWAKYTQAPQKLKRFKTVHTLFNVNESIIDIQPEWFSKMKDLSVLHLGKWDSRTTVHIELGNHKFLEDLKNMKQLKFFSLQGVSTIMKLPDSICKLTNLIILDLRECHTLEELPPDVGSLKNLTHLDITNCHLLTKLPKGISVLLKLEVLRGFPIYDLAGGPQDKKACILSRCWKKAKGWVIHTSLGYKNKEFCTLRDLLNLKKLRELSITVNRDNFPNSEELEVFKAMENLSKLSISWVWSIKDDKKSNSSGQPDANQGDNEAPKEDQGDIKAPEECQGENQAHEEHQGDIEALEEDRENNKAPEERESLDQIEKLDLWCFPYETAPEWMVPSQLKNLKKLYIRGGKLKGLPGCTNGNEWKVTTLRLKYLTDLVMKWTDLKANFPNMTYLEMYECNKLGLFPCDRQGVWIAGNREFPDQELEM